MQIMEYERQSRLAGCLFLVTINVNGSLSFFLLTYQVLSHLIEPHKQFPETCYKFTGTMPLITHFKLHSQCLAWFESCTITLGTKKQKFSMRIHSLFYGALLGLWLCLFAVSFCHASSGDMHFGYLEQYFNFYNVVFYFFYLDFVTLLCILLVHVLQSWMRKRSSNTFHISQSTRNHSHTSHSSRNHFHISQ